MHYRIPKEEIGVSDRAVVSMKIVKFNKRLLKKDWVDILRYFGLVDDTKNRAYPSRLYMSKEDIKEARNNYRKKLRKKLDGFISKTRLDYHETMVFLDLGANQQFQDALKSGYALVANEEENE